MGYELFPLMILAGLVPAAIAHRKGGSFLVYWVFGAILFIVALPIALTMAPNGKVLVRREEENAAERGEARCPACREFIRADASICPHCRCETHMCPTPPERWGAASESILPNAPPVKGTVTV